MKCQNFKLIKKTKKTIHYRLEQLVAELSVSCSTDELCSFYVL